MKHNILPIITLKTSSSEYAILPGAGLILKYIPELHSYDVIVQQLKGYKEGWKEFLNFLGTNYEEVFNKFNTLNKSNNLSREKLRELKETLELLNGKKIDDFSDYNFLSKFDSNKKLENILPELSENLSMLLSKDIMLKKTIEFDPNELFRPSELASITLYNYEIKRINNLINQIKINNFKEINSTEYPDFNFLATMDNNEDKYKIKGLIRIYITLKNKYPDISNDEPTIMKQKIKRFINSLKLEKFYKMPADFYFSETEKEEIVDEVLEALLVMLKYEDLFIKEKYLDMNNLEENVYYIIESFQKNKDKIKKKMKKNIIERLKIIKKDLMETKKKESENFKNFINNELKNILSEKLKDLKNYDYTDKEIETLEEKLYKEIKKTHNEFQKILKSISGKTKKEYFRNVRNIIDHFLNYKEENNYLEYLGNKVINKSFLKSINFKEKYKLNNENNLKNIQSQKLT